MSIPAKLYCCSLSSGELEVNTVLRKDGKYFVVNRHDGKRGQVHEDNVGQWIFPTEREAYQDRLIGLHKCESQNLQEQKRIEKNLEKVKAEIIEVLEKLTGV